MTAISSYFSDDSLHTAWAEYLMSRQDTWAYFITQTSRRVRRDAYNFASVFWDLCTKKFDFTHSFVAVEPHKLDGIHIHALVGNAKEWCNTQMGIQRVLTKIFGFSSVQPIRNTATVTYYCTKYVTKGNEFFLFGNDEYYRNT